MSRPILIFPAGMPRSLEYLQKCLREGQAVVGASSLGMDPAQGQYPGWVRLPYVTEANFDTALKGAIADFDISGIYTPNPVVWDYLHQVLPQLAPDVRLLNEAPVNMELDGYRTARNQGRSTLLSPLPVASSLIPKSLPSEIDLAALYFHAEKIPGMCDREKTQALCEIARYTVPGDLVEIGSWWGKSAFILAWLAQSYAIGPLLCVDPWSSEHLVQHDTKGLVDRVSAQLDADEALVVFEMNLLRSNSNNINYLRMPSVDAARHYRNRSPVITKTFGQIAYCGNISILHIDGNHALSAVRADVASWTGLVQKGGWIIIDDYLWPYGNGPRQAGDEFLLANRERLGCAFVTGGALFLQLSPD